MKKLNKILIAPAVIFSGIIAFSGQGAFAASPAPVNLGTAGNFVILAKTGISTTGNTTVLGDIGISPAAASYVTGFALDLPASGAYSMSSLIAGKVYAPGYANPTPAILTAAILDMQTAYTDASGRAPSVTELGAGNIGGMTLVPGVYKWGTGLTIPTDVTLSGGANDVWIFQIAQNLSVSSGVRVFLAGGAQASNIFWVVGGQTTLGTTSVFNGNILDQTSIILNTGAQLNGRALAQAAVTLDASTVTIPAASNSATPATPAVPATPTSSPATPAIPATPSTQSLKDQVNALVVILQSLQAQRAAQQGASAPASAFGQQVRTIATSLGQGSRGSNVAILQQFLISQNKGPAAKALANAGATAYFGGVTRAALAEFQASVGISPALGNFGSITRAYVSTHY